MDTRTPRAGAPSPIKHLLESYTTSHPLRSPSPLPPSSRVDPSLSQKLPPVASNPLFWTISTWIAFLRFAIAKGIHVIWSLIKHFLWGPARRSWGYRMTFIVSFMRNVADYTDLADIVLIRRLISLSFLIPLPSDAVVTPITFLVPRRTGEDVARGFFRDLDSVESGNRELTGEWVVGTEVWKRLKAEKRSSRLLRKLDGGRDSPDVDSEPGEAAQGSKSSEKVIYYIHGGAYYVGNAATHRLITIGVSKACNARVFAITYRLAPENAFPLPLHDVLHGYQRLLAPPLSIPPENIIVAGDSAGGGLGLALCLYLRDEGYDMPAGLILMSPWVDLTMSCGSWDENSDWDVVPRPSAGDHLNPVSCYLGPKGIFTYLTHPYASPLFGDLQGLPPMLIQAGDSEVLRDEITLLAHKATLSGVEVTHELYEDMVHVFQTFTFLPTAKVAISSIGRWVRVTLPQIEEHRRRTGISMDALGLTKGDKRDPSLTLRAPSWSRLDRPKRTPTRTPTADKTSIDLDSLPAGTSRSGSPTPVGSPDLSASPASIGSTSTPFPRLRRSRTSFDQAEPPSPSRNPILPNTWRRRRTQTIFGSPSLQALPSSQVSPSPSIRLRLRSASNVTLAPKHRKASHTDIFDLVEEYQEGGAANETVVYAPGGEVRSVGPLNESDESEE